MLSNLNLQRQILRLYGEFVCRWDDLGGKLVFAEGEGAVSTGLTVAGSIAGAATLVVDPDVAATKAVLRSGGVDFVVNTLDEALRVLKNEIRQKRPLSVALTADPHSVLAEMLERGVRPDVWLAFATGREIVPALAGVPILRLKTGEAGAEPSDPLAAWLDELGWDEVTLAAGTRQALRESDAALLAKLHDGIRHRWLSRISQYFRPQQDFERCLWLHAEEPAMPKLP